MPNGVLTRWELTPNDKFNEFYTEFIDYLQQSLIRVPRFPDAQESELIWVCPENFMKIIKGCGDPDFGWAMYSRRFCESKNFYRLSIAFNYDSNSLYSNSSCFS